MISSAPYPGLRPFRRDEADIFFGREEQTDRLLEKLGETRFVAVVGASGCGKSSLVNAGLIAALEAGFLAMAGGRWRVASMRPGNRPLLRLAEALLDPDAMGNEIGSGPEMLGFSHAVLRRGPLSMVEILRETPLPEFTNLLIVVDQFEEIFRYRKEVDRDEADAFVALLLESASQREVPVYIVITMRSDFFGDCSVFRGLPEAINQGQFLAPRLKRDELRSAIEGPARVFGGDVDPALVNRLLNDMGADSDQLPLMQHAMMRMWNILSTVKKSGDIKPDHLVAEAKSKTKIILTLKEYEAVGGLADALSLHADEAFADLDDEGQHLAQVLFQALTERSFENRDTRRPTTLRELASISGFPLQRVVEVVEIFRCEGQSFFIPPVCVQLNPETVIDISHETLIRQWKRLNDWVAEEAKSAEMYRFLLNSARRWDIGEGGLWRGLDLDSGIAWREKERPTPAWSERYGSGFDLAVRFLDASEGERRRELIAAEESRKKELQRTRLWLAVTSCGFLITCIIAMASWYYKNKAEKQENIANAQQLAAMASTKLRGSDDDRKLALEMALCAVSLYKSTKKNVPPNVEDILRRIHFFLNISLPNVPSKPVAFALSAGPTPVAATADNRITVWNIMNETDSDPIMYSISSAGRKVHPLEKVSAPCTISLSPDGKYLVSGGKDGVVRITEPLAGRKQVLVRSVPKSPVQELVYSPDGKTIAIAWADGTIILHDVKPLRVSKHLKLDKPKYNITGLAFSPPNLALLDFGTIRIWDTTQKKITLKPLPTATPLKAISFSPSGRRLAAAGNNGEIFLWDMKTFKQIKPLVPKVNAVEVTGISFCNKEQMIAGAYTDNMIRIWSISNNKLILAIPCFPSPPKKVAYVEKKSGGFLVLLDSTGKLRRIKLSKANLETDLKKVIEQAKKDLNFDPKKFSEKERDPEKWADYLIHQRDAIQY